MIMMPPINPAAKIAVASGRMRWRVGVALRARMRGFRYDKADILSALHGTVDDKGIVA